MSLDMKIKKNLGGFQLDVELHAGNETLALLGASGCGKSMTLRCIAGIETPDEGYIRVDGETLFDSEEKIDVPVQKRHVGLLFQNYALFPNMNVEQNIMLGMKSLPMPKDQKTAECRRVIEKFYLGGLEKHSVRQLSGGQQQRVALARALVIRPRVLLLDECLSALDKKLRVEMQSELRRILEESQVTTFFVTHDQEEAMTLSDTIVVMRDGVIEQTGTPYEVYERPANRFVAGFLGKANFIEENGVTYAVRPEKIKIGSADDPAARMSGVVESLVYSGNLTTCTVNCGQINIVAELANADTAQRLSRGEKVSVLWDDSAQIKLAD